MKSTCVAKKIDRKHEEAPLYKKERKGTGWQKCAKSTCVAKMVDRKC